MDINYWLQQYKINDGFSVIRNYEVFTFDCICWYFEAKFYIIIVKGNIITEKKVVNLLFRSIDDVWQFIISILLSVLYYLQ